MRFIQSCLEVCSAREILDRDVSGIGCKQASMAIGGIHGIPRIFALAAANSVSSRIPSSCRVASSLMRSAVDDLEGWAGGSCGIVGCGAVVAALPRIVWATFSSAWPTSRSSEFVLTITWTSWSVVIVRVAFFSSFLWSRWPTPWMASPGRVAFMPFPTNEVALRRRELADDSAALLLLLSSSENEKARSFSKGATLVAKLPFSSSWDAAIRT